MSNSGTASLDDEQLRRVLGDQWNISVASLELLGGELDRTFRVVDVDDAVFCVKVREQAGVEFDLELAALAHLASFDEVEVPRLVRAVSGDDFWRDSTRAVWVLRWLDGLRWADLPWRASALAYELGQRARQLSNALATFDHPAAHRTHHWDVRSASAAIEMHRDQAGARSSAVERTLELLGPAEAALASLPQSVVHQDMNDHNVIVDMVEGTASVVGIIDFGDTLHSATITELVLPVAYAMLRTDHPLDAAAAVVAGWYGDQEPPAAELEVIFPLALGRLMVNALTWSARSADQPEYADARSRHTWQTIDQLINTPPALVVAAFGGERLLQPRRRLLSRQRSLARVDWSTSTRGARSSTPSTRSMRRHCGRPGEETGPLLWATTPFVSTTAPMPTEPTAPPPCSSRSRCTSTLAHRCSCPLPARSPRPGPIVWSSRTASTGRCGPTSIGPRRLAPPASASTRARKLGRRTMLPAASSCSRSHPCPRITYPPWYAWSIGQRGRSSASILRLSSVLLAATDWRHSTTPQFEINATLASPRRSATTTESR